MQLAQSNLLQSLKEIQKFLDDNAEHLTGVAESGSRKKLDTLVIEVTKYAAVQSANRLAAKSATQRLRALTDTLLDHHMPTIARVAVAELSPLPELTPLGMPKTRQTGERLVALARGMANEAKKYESTFVAAGVPADFIKEIEEEADAIGGFISERKQYQAMSGAATTVLSKRLTEARRFVNVLDAFVKARAKNNQPVLEAWKIVKRFRQSPVSAKPIDEQLTQRSTPATPTGAAA